MDKYSIILPNEKAKTYSYVTLFILTINLLVFGFVHFKAIDQRLIDLSLKGAVFCLLSFAVLLIQKFAKKNYNFRIEIIFFILSVLWFLMDRWLLALCIVCFAVIGIYTRR